MATSTTISVRVEPKLKKDALKIADGLGLSMGEVFSYYLGELVRTKKLSGATKSTPAKAAPAKKAVAKKAPAKKAVAKTAAKKPAAKAVQEDVKKDKKAKKEKKGKKDKKHKKNKNK